MFVFTHVGHTIIVEHDLNTVCRVAGVLREECKSKERKKERYQRMMNGRIPVGKSSPMQNVSVQVPNTGGEVDQRCSWLRVAFTRFWKFCSAYGAIFAYYGSALGGLAASLVVTIVNE